MSTQTSTFTPSTGTADTLTFDQILANDGVYGSGSDDPKVVVIQGVAFDRNLSDGDLTGVLQGVPPETRFRALQGTLSLTITS